MQKRNKYSSEETLTSSRTVGARDVGEALGSGVGECDGFVGRSVVGLGVGDHVGGPGTTGEAVGNSVKSCTLQ